MLRNLLTVIAGALLVAACSYGGSDMPSAIDTHPRLFKPDLPSEEVMAAGVVPANYQPLIDVHLDSVLPHPQSRLVVFQRRPYGGLVCGNIDFISETNQQMTKTPFIAVFDDGGNLEAMQFYTLADIDTVIDRHNGQEEHWWAQLWFVAPQDNDDWQTEMSYSALTKCGFIV